MTGGVGQRKNPYRVLMHPVTLKFPASIERGYYEHLSAQFGLGMALLNLIGIMGTGVFIYLFAGVMGYTNPHIYWLCCLAILLSLIGLVFSRLLFKPTYGEYILAGGALLIQACWLSVAVVLPDPWLKSSFAFFMLVSLFDFLMLPVRYPMRIATGTIFVIFFASFYYANDAYPTIIGEVGLMNTYVIGVVFFGVIGGRQSEISSRTDFLMRHELDQEKSKSETLLFNAIPPKIAERLKISGEQIADFLPEVTVMFVDISGFTAFVKSTSASTTVKLLNHLFSEFDHCIAGRRCEKIKTIGDAYLIVGGTEDGDSDHPERMLALLADLRRALEHFNRQHDTAFLLRAGIHTGPVIAGVIGKTKFTYDLWGETVNFASRLESNAGAGETLTSESFASRVASAIGVAESRRLDLKGIGTVDVAVLDSGRKQAAA